MPITQDRLLALVTAAKDYQDGLRKLLKQINIEIASQRAAPSPDWGSAIDMILLHANEHILLDYPMISPSTIFMEEDFLRRNARSNVRAAIRQRAKRRAAGVMPRQTAPTAIFASSKAPNYDMLRRGFEAHLPVIEEAARLRSESLVTRGNPGGPIDLTSIDINADIAAFTRGLSDQERAVFEANSKPQRISSIASHLEPLPETPPPEEDLAPAGLDEDDPDGFLANLGSQAKGPEDDPG